MWIMTRQELATDAKSTSARNRLSAGDTTLIQWGRVGTIREFGSELGEITKTGNREVLLVTLGVVDALLGLNYASSVNTDESLRV